MESWRVFAAATDLDEALSTAHEVQADDGAVEEEIRTLCEKDWSVLTKQDSQALFNLLQNCSLIIPEALRRATLCKALACARAAFRLAGVVGCQHAQLDDDLVQRLAELCTHEKNGTVVARAATTIRGSLQWPRDKDVVCRILNARNDAFDDVSAVAIEGSGEAAPEQHTMTVPVHQQVVAQWQAYRDKKAKGGFAFLGGGLRYIPNLVELELEEHFPDLHPGQLAQCASMFGRLAKGQESVSREAILAWTTSKGDNLTQEAVDKFFQVEPGQSIDVVHFIRGIMALSAR